MQFREALPAVGLGTSGPFEVGTDAAARAPLREVLGAFFASGATLIDTSSGATAGNGATMTRASPASYMLTGKVCGGSSPCCSVACSTNV